MIKEILSHVVTTYGSLRSPDFSTVKYKESREIQSVCNALSRVYRLNDISDFNDDVCFRYQLKKGGLCAVVELSLIGPYAVILKNNKDDSTSLVTETADGQEFGKLVSIIHENGFKTLSIEALETPILLKLQNARENRTCLYHALFSDIDILPWESS